MPKLIKDKDGIEGFDFYQLYEWMRKLGMDKKWSEWLHGQTGVSVGGKMIVYRQEVERFISGKPSINT